LGEVAQQDHARQRRAVACFERPSRHDQKIDCRRDPECLPSRLIVWIGNSSSRIPFSSVTSSISLIDKYLEIDAEVKKWLKYADDLDA
jgi:hypothetical protein